MVIKLHEPLSECAEDTEGAGSGTVGDLLMLSPRTAPLMGGNGFPNIIVVFFLDKDCSSGGPGDVFCPEVISRIFEGIFTTVLERNLDRGLTSTPTRQL